MGRARAVITGFLVGCGAAESLVALVFVAGEAPIAPAPRKHAVGAVQAGPAAPALVLAAAAPGQPVRYWTTDTASEEPQGIVCDCPVEFLSEKPR